MNACNHHPNTHPPRSPNAGAGKFSLTHRHRHGHGRAHEHGQGQGHGHEPGHGHGPLMITFSLLDDHMWMDGCMDRWMDGWWMMDDSQ
eukprot:3731789-Karenia_brevis.AAC.1